MLLIVTNLLLSYCKIVTEMYTFMCNRFKLYVVYVCNMYGM